MPTLIKTYRARETVRAIPYRPGHAACDMPGVVAENDPYHRGSFGVTIDNAGTFYATAGDYFLLDENDRIVTAMTKGDFETKYEIAPPTQKEFDDLKRLAQSDFMCLGRLG